LRACSPSSRRRPPSRCRRPRRQYDAAVGRFTGEDPLTAPNRYVYALDDPLGYRDPLGLQAAVEYSTLTDRQAKQTQTTSYSVYRFWDVNQRWYYGMTQNLEQRIAAHGARVTQGTVQELIKGIPERNIARAIEQAFFERAGGVAGRSGTQGPLANIINAMVESEAQSPILVHGREVVAKFMQVTADWFVPLPPVP